MFKNNEIISTTKRDSIAFYANVVHNENGRMQLVSKEISADDFVHINDELKHDRMVVYDRFKTN